VCVFLNRTVTPNNPLKQLVLQYSNGANHLAEGQTLVTVDLRPHKDDIADRAAIFLTYWGAGFEKIESVYLSNKADGGNGEPDLTLRYGPGLSGPANINWGQDGGISWVFRDNFATAQYGFDIIKKYDYLFIKLSEPFNSSGADNVCVFLNYTVNPGNPLKQLVLQYGNGANDLLPGQTFIGVDLRPYKDALTDRAAIFLTYWGAGFGKIESIYLSNVPDGVLPGGSANGGGYYYSGSYL
jgi:hypothetical protein